MNKINGCVLALLCGIRQWAVEFCNVYLTETLAFREEEDSEGINWRKLCEGVYAFEAWFVISGERKLTLSFMMVNVAGFDGRGFSQHWALFGLELSIVSKEGVLERKVPFTHDEMKDSGLLTGKALFEVMPPDAFFKGVIAGLDQPERVWLVEDGKDHPGGMSFVGFQDFANKIKKAVADIQTE